MDRQVQGARDEAKFFFFEILRTRLKIPHYLVLKLYGCIVTREVGLSLLWQ
jgi:hypothetical protein